MRSKPREDFPISPGDMVELFLIQSAENRGKRSSLQAVLDLDRSSWTVTIPSSSGRTMKGTIGDVRPALLDDSFASLVCQENYELETQVEQLLSIDPQTTAHVDIYQTDIDTTSSEFEPSYENSDDDQNLAIGDRFDIL